MRLTIKILLILILLISGCTVVQPRKITPAEKKRILDVFWERQYLEYQLRKAEKEFGVE